MTLEEVIKHCEKVADDCDKQYIEHPNQLGYIERFYSLKECADKHIQLAEWLKELRDRRKNDTLGKWINHYDDLFPAESTIECSLCHAEQYYCCDDNYCPNCGAKMEKE